MHDLLLFMTVNSITSLCLGNESSGYATMWRIN